MSIFRRSKPADPQPVAPDEADPAEEAVTDEAGAEEVPTAQAASPRPGGPFDVNDVEGREGRLDLGALWVRGVQGMELRLEVEQESQQVNAATAVLGESALQVQAFAAPRSSGLWEDIRAEIARTVQAQGGTAEERTGDLGTELRTRMPSAGPDGRTVFAPATFLGVDGPRWFLRGVLSGRAAIDDAAAAPLLEVFRGLVVVRGGEPMAPRELLPLRLPRDAQPEPEDDESAEGTGIDPFERGPEITEVR
ncbi:DUF3710 domain-containing protein [Phycicoccus endophyticus]|uniref:DUF3710 domain-containing protein n=1 Tax=Phycicoccus endophyticus TaxID=1690220 RepID=A0A7G9R4V4_9MICO|nr:DUF3710 domain-containing protein [Phycicoccus endophyticus]NHI18552.1 DUF3710 domain-containing protein [Phycicoccus endophyticus]QNN50629.1 DUF3710 domain-containing protein [Phycicoccus endophyticus]GGL22842.1 hypothetical protein GCM10012283_01210 [Phycicoccus endophyticus]